MIWSIHCQKDPTSFRGYTCICSNVTKTITGTVASTSGMVGMDADAQNFKGKDLK